MPSTVIHSYQYDPAACRLDIRFVSGETYSYFDVPQRIVAGLARAISKGRYFQSHIRDRFAYRRDRTGQARAAS
ncbi:KTSC domain-containing protein [Sphingobium nicotianae]|uniref:KTSC domain-containing protein n=1 Tax=Sphingobium nicotianae TaxID=2782607 RepID=A0A9X1IQ65_9SPHN|nr:KTSC domain-containing protein [Sphingobium nicotianae]MBT2186315.1 KTSC domain-containing protein [Sphingobium nicotianae]